MRGTRREEGISLTLHPGSAVSMAVPLSSCISFSNTLIHSAPLPAGKTALGMGKDDIVFLLFMLFLFGRKVRYSDSSICTACE